MGFITPPSGSSDPVQALRPDHTPESPPAIVCPHCQSDAWKTAALVYSEGISSVNLRTKGVGGGIGVVGLRDGKVAIGGGVHSSHTAGFQQTLLSARLTPPRKRGKRALAVLVILCLFSGWGLVTGIAHKNILAVLINAVMTTVLAYAATALQQRQQRKYEVAMKSYKNTIVCQRCGALYSRRPS